MLWILFIALLGLLALYAYRTKRVPCILHVQEPWFSEIVAGRKTVEGRVGGTFKMQEFQSRVGTDIYFRCDRRRIRATLIGVTHYPSLAVYIQSVGFATCAPQTTNDFEAKQAYLGVCIDNGSMLPIQVFSPDRVTEGGGICALKIKVSTP